MIVLATGIAVAYVALKWAMAHPTAFAVWGSITLFYLPLGIVLLALPPLIRRRRPRPTPASVSAAIIIAIDALYWSTDHDNRLTPFNLAITSLLYIAMYLTGLLPVLVALSLRQRWRAAGAA